MTPSPATASERLAVPLPAAAPAQQLPSHAPSLGRSAALLHGLAWAVIGITAFVNWVLGMLLERYTVLGVGGAAAVALLCWSAVLALRGFARGESKRLTLGVWALFVVQAGVVGMLLWPALLYWGGSVSELVHWGLFLGLPAWGVFLFLGSCFAAPLAWLRARLKRRETERACEPAWSGERLRGYGMKWYALYMGLIGAVVLPFLLYVSSALVLGMAKGNTWQGLVVKATPDFVKRASYSLASQHEFPRHRAMRFGLIAGGKLPFDSLEQAMASWDLELAELSSRVIFQEHREAALAYAADPKAVELKSYANQIRLAEAVVLYADEEVRDRVRRELPRFPPPYAQYFRYLDARLRAETP